MPIVLGNIAVCPICDTLYELADWDNDWDEHGCPVCIEQTKGD
ncbi:MAG: hypothetical protein ACTSPB_13680 [Candidatus Thorarchaeota archaeon]